MVDQPGRERPPEQPREPLGERTSMPSGRSNSAVREPTVGRPGLVTYAGFITLRGGTFGWIMGYTFAVLGIIRWLFYVPVAPVLSVVIVALNMLVIYALVQHSDYFQGFRSGP